MERWGHLVSVALSFSGFLLCVFSRKISTSRPSYYTLGGVVGVFLGIWLVTRQRVGESSIVFNIVSNVVFFFVDWKYRYLYYAFCASCGVAAVYYMMFDVDFAASPIPTITLWSLRQIGVTLMFVGDWTSSAVFVGCGALVLARDWYFQRTPAPSLPPVAPVPPTETEPTEEEPEEDDTRDERRRRLAYLKEGRDNARIALRRLAKTPEFQSWLSSHSNITWSDADDESGGGSEIDE